jgi:CHAT domain-containing protein/tetratricopeptide (TPR) repeat protein
MNDDLNPAPPTGQASGPQEDLAAALDDLRAAASPRIAASLGQPRPFPSAQSGPCPELGDWLRLAMGETPAGESEALLSHASVCAACLARLRASQRALSSEASSAETAELSNFASMTSQWQHRLAVELAHTPAQPKLRRTPSVFIWSGLAAAALLLLAVAATVWWRQQNAPERLLAQAYSTARTFDLRVPGAGFAPVVSDTHLRGGSTGRESAPLLSAREQIESKLEKDPNDPHWLQLQARSQILEENYDAATDILDRLIAAGPVTPGLLTDAGSAYYLRGTATGSENDRATALDYLRRADELAPSDPVILFNEALVMEDRGQVMNAVETWNRFLKFERDPKWLDEGRARLNALEAKLDRLKTHESRMQQHLASPQAMRALAADPATLARIDEEFTTIMLPRLLDTAYPPPGDRSRGSPCYEMCLAARSLLHALASSLQSNHQDPWLARFLPSDSSPLDIRFTRAAHALGQSIDANTRGSFSVAEDRSIDAASLFDRLGNSAGAARADVERIYAFQRSFVFAECNETVAELLPDVGDFPWIKAQTVSLSSTCNMNPGTAAMNNPAFEKALQLALQYHYPLLELRARNMLGDLAVDAGDSETAWRIGLETVRKYYEGDYPVFRIATTMSGLAWGEDSTPRAHLDLLLNEETFNLFSLAPNRATLSSSRAALIRAAFRVGALQEVRMQTVLAQKEDSLAPDQKGLQGIQAENAMLMAELYLDRGDLAGATQMLNAAQTHMAGEDNALQQRKYSLLRGELELAQGHAGAADSLLHAAIVEEEQEAKGTGRENITFARADRDLYAVLAGVWLAESRPSLAILALWERYRLRILGLPVPACPAGQLDCLAPELDRALQRDLRSESGDTLAGQVVLRDRVLLYRADGRKVSWKSVPLAQSELLAAAASLERLASTPSSSQTSVDQAARKLGDILLSDLPSSSMSGGILVLEPDPLLGNLPWAAVETAGGPIGLHFNLEESPSILQPDSTAVQSVRGKPLIVGASAAAGEPTLLPEVLREARAIALVGPGSITLLANEATQPNVVAHLASAPLVHFAGHAIRYEGSTRLLLASSGFPGDKPYLDRSLLLKDPPRSARLVVFSACSTGKREEGWNHDMGDIVDTLASLGVPEVVATRWQIDSASAVPMMSAFYHGLAGGLRVPQALTAARKSLVRDARYSHPYYWAAYYASGVGNTDLREVFHGESSEEISKNFEIR